MSGAPVGLNSDADGSTVLYLLAMLPLLIAAGWFIWREREYFGWFFAVLLVAIGVTALIALFAWGIDGLLS